jgi:PhoPQ-activated pathogenicity-related protein
MRRLSFGLVFLIALAQYALAGPPTALDEYVAKPDASYKWTLAKTIDAANYQAYILDLTSQTWAKASNKSQWQHWLEVIVPKNCSGTTAFLLIDGGQTSAAPPRDVDSLAKMVALQTRSISVYLPTVPNQPLKFADEDFGHTEDMMVCYTLDKFMKTGDKSWPAYLPMTNSAIRAMDAVQEFVPTIGDKKMAVDKFVLAGGSKRGWTTWLATAVDPKSRVIAMIPAVADLANLAVQMEFHRKTYQGLSANMKDGYSTALGDWLHYNIFPRLATPEGKAMLAIIDPYSYFDRENMKVPKYLVHGADDDYFTPGSANNYFDKLQGVSYLRYVPNAGHKLNYDAIMGLVNFYQAVKNGDKLPKFDWKIQNDGRTIVVNTQDKPKQVLLWKATNPKSRDFRLATFGAKWTSTPLSDQGNGVFRAEISPPKTGATAALIEMTYDVGGKNIRFSTSITFASAAP